MRGRGRTHRKRKRTRRRNKNPRARLDVWRGPEDSKTVALDSFDTLMVFGSLFGSVLTGSIGGISERIQEPIEPDDYFKFPTIADVF